MTDAPPSRYKVVERGRRLVVIDTQTGQPAVRERVPEAPVKRERAGGVDDRSGNAILTTSRLYDRKGPREIVMDARFNDRLGKAIGLWLVGAFFAGSVALLFAPWLLLLPFAALFQPRVRAAIRDWITARLDEVQAAS